MLDVVGPSEVFHTAVQLGAPIPYELRLVSSAGGPVRSSSGLVVDTDPIDTIEEPVDTLMTTGGVGVRAAVEDRRLVDGVRRLAAQSTRVTSVCTGAFL